MKKILLLALVLILLSLVNTPVCYANSAEPPSILIIVPNAPTDLEISIETENVKAYRTDKASESYYTFYSRNLKSVDYTVKVTTGNRAFDIVLDTPLKTYNNIFTLDLENQTLTPGKSISRSIRLVSLRVILTLLIEAIIFYLFGFRKKRSWLIFLIVNLITQGVLYIGLNNAFSPLDNYMIIFRLVLAEILIFIVEIIVFLRLLKERSRGRTSAYVIVANLLSLVLGGFLITVLPI